MVLAAFLFLKRMSDIAEVRQWTYRDPMEEDKLSEEVQAYLSTEHVDVEEYDAVVEGLKGYGWEIRF